MLYGSLDGRGVWKRMDLCLCMAESLTLHPKLSQYFLLISCTQYKIKSLEKSSPCSAQLEKACAQQWRPSTTEILKSNTWRGIKSAPLCGTYPPQALGSPPLPTAPRHLGQGAPVFAIMSTLLFFIIRGKFCIATSLSRVQNVKDKSIVIFLYLAGFTCLPSLSRPAGIFTSIPLKS